MLTAAMAAIMENNKVILFPMNDHSGRLYATQYNDQIKILFAVGKHGLISVYGEYYNLEKGSHPLILGQLMLDWLETIGNMGYKVTRVATEIVPAGLVIIAKLNSK
jgi:hypothetical protein